MSWLNNIEFWHWWVLAGVLMTLELALPGSILLWTGISALVTGFVLLLLPGMGWEYQGIIFAVMAVVSCTIVLVYFRKELAESDDPMLNRRGSQLVGRVVTLEEPIVNGTGRINISDTVWKVEGRDLPAGARVKITGVSGTVLSVEPG
ncbi:MAG: NfeD family protein [Alphaproteobacteria bacterium]